MRFARFTASLLVASFAAGSVGSALAQPVSPGRHDNPTGAPQGRQTRSENHATPGRHAASHQTPQGYHAAQPGGRQSAVGSRDSGPHGDGRARGHGATRHVSSQPARAYPQPPAVVQVPQAPAVVYSTPQPVVIQAAPSSAQGWHPGDRLPPDGGAYVVVDNWRDHRLEPPLRGQQWVRIGTDFALVAIATGIIAQVILGGR